MTLATEYTLRCGTLAEELEMRYHELRDELNLKYKERVSPSTVAQMTMFAVEDALNRRTSSHVKEHASLLDNFIFCLLDQEVALDEEDREIIESDLIRPIMEEAEELVSGILEKHDKFFSLWELEPINGELDEIIVKYLGDFRVQAWHLINNVGAKEEVNVKRFRVRLKTLSKPIEIAMEEGFAVSDRVTMLEKVINYYSNGSISIDFEDMVNWISRINDVPGKQRSLDAASNLVTTILRAIESDDYIKDLLANIKVAERTYADLSKRVVRFDVIMPSINIEQSDKRQEILNEIEKQSYIPESMLENVGIKYV